MSSRDHNLKSYKVWFIIGATLFLSYALAWAEVLEADAFEYFKETSIFSEETGAKFKEHVLSKGGSEHPMDLYVKFRGNEPSTKPLLRKSGLIK